MKEEAMMRASEPHGTVSFVLVDTRSLTEWGVPEDVLHELVPSLAVCRFEKGKPLVFKLHSVATNNVASIMFQRGKFTRMVLRRDLVEDAYEKQF